MSRARTGVLWLFAGLGWGCAVGLPARLLLPSDSWWRQAIVVAGVLAGVAALFWLLIGVIRREPAQPAAEPEPFLKPTGRHRAGG